MFTNLIKRWEFKASTGNHFDVLDGLRGMAILMVVAFHTFYTNPDAGVLATWVGYFIYAGAMGVPIFFVLSGFLISYPFMTRRQINCRFWYPQGYASRRIGKIIPPFYLSILIFLAVYWIQYHDAIYLDAAWKWATGLANWVYVPPNFNNSYWSLIVESHFYIVLPMLFWLTRGLSLKNTTLALVLILLVIPSLVRWITYSEQPSAVDVMNRFPCNLDYFAWGVAFSGMYVGLKSEHLKLRQLSYLGSAGFAGLLVCMLNWHNFKIIYLKDYAIIPWKCVEAGHWLPGIATFLMLFFLFDPGCFMAKLLAASWLRFIGIVSYEWFLFHGPVVHFFREHLGQTHGSFWLYIFKTIVPLALTFAFSVVVYRWFSLPILRGIRSGLKNSTPS